MPIPHAALPEFDYLKPDTLEAASQYLAAHAGTARPFMGGTDVFGRLRDGVWTDKVLVDVKHFAGTDSIEFDPRKGLTLGAAVNMNRVIASEAVNAYYPLLAQAARSVASYQLRSRATIAGNLCNGSPAGDTTGACIALGAVLEVHGTNGIRREPVSGFITAPGQTKLQPGDIVTAIHFPMPPDHCTGVYLKLNRNKLGDLAIVGVTVLGCPDWQAHSGYRFRIVLASVAPTPIEPKQAEAVLSDEAISTSIIEAAAQAAMEACNPIDDVRGSARYRKYMVRNLTRQAVTQVWNELRSR